MVAGSDWSERGDLQNSARTGSAAYWVSGLGNIHCRNTYGLP
jgi:hypothetical protein